MDTIVSSNFDPQQNVQDIDYYRYAEIQEWYDFINKQPSQLHIIHWNVCSLRKHFNELLVFLEECIDNLDVICLTEINIKREEMYRYTCTGIFGQEKNGEVGESYFI